MINFSGNPLRKITGKSLPTNHQVLGRLLYLHYNEKLKLANCYENMSNELINIWLKTKIPVQRKDSIKVSIKNIYLSFAALNKHKDRTSANHKEQENIFLNKLPNLFDIAAINALDLIDDNRKLFLECNRNEIYNNEKLSDIGKKINYHLRIFPECDKIPKSSSIASTNVVENFSCDFDTQQKTDTDSEYEPPIKTAKQTVETKHKKISPVNSNVAAALDRCGISDTEALYILSAEANALGLDLTKFSMSRSTIYRERQKYRESISENIREQFSQNTSLIIHWDGKRLIDSTSNQEQPGNVERLAIVVSGLGESKILAIPKLQSGTGLAQANAIFQTLEYWDIVKNIKGMGFDTTSSNTGQERGAAYILASKFEQPLMFFACRHHVAELLLKSAFVKTVEGSTCGPDIRLFDRFREEWNNLDTNNFTGGIEEEEILVLFPEQCLYEITEFIKNQLSFHKTHARHDYIEFLELALVFLNKHDSNYKLRKPGAVSRARWMAKGIYSFKIYSLRNQFRLTGNFKAFVFFFHLFTIF